MWCQRGAYFFFKIRFVFLYTPGNSMSNTMCSNLYWFEKCCDNKWVTNMSLKSNWELSTKRNIVQRGSNSLTMWIFWKIILGLNTPKAALIREDVISYYHWILPFMEWKYCTKQPQIMGSSNKLMQAFNWDHVSFNLYKNWYANAKYHFFLAIMKLVFSKTGLNQCGTSLTRLQRLDKR